MKKLYLLLTFLFLTHFAKAQDPDAFIMTFETGQFNSSITVPIGIDEGYANFTIDFGDGTVLANQTGTVYHTYPTPGIYTVTVSGQFNSIIYGSGIGSCVGLKTIEQWGNTVWSILMFKNCYNLITINATDTPNLTQVIIMNSMFEGASAFNQPLNDWDVSNVKNMANMFKGASAFNQPLNDWDVSNVVDMGWMFNQASSFNQPLNNWDVSNVANMSSMFYQASSFNQPLNDWDISSVTNMYYMFEGASSFNQPLNNWDVSNVTNMSYMFEGASSFNQPLNDWDVSNVTNMRYMFNQASSFNQPLNNWDVSNVTDMRYMFNQASSFNQPLNNWDVSNVTYMWYMFEGASSFNQPLNNWDVSNVTYMSYMFRSASSFNQPLNNWDVSNVTSMNRMFNQASSFNQNLSGWNFKSDVNLNYFLNSSGLDIINYDLLLLRFVDLELQNKTLGATGLQYCNSLVRNYLINNLGWTITGDSLADDCDYNMIYGNVFFDENNNGCDSDDTKTDVFLVNANNGTPYYSTSPNSGEYSLNLLDDTYIVSLLVPDYFTVTPESYSVSYTDFGNTEELNFCLTASQTVQDLNITLLPITEARPGFEADYQIIVQNIGTQTVNNISVSLDFDSTMQSFVSAVPSPSSTTTNQLNFDITSLSPFSSTIINFTMQTFTPPTVNSDDILNFTATVSPNTNDYTPNDNTFELAQIVVNSFDPNDKQVLQGSEIYIDDVNGYLHYLIRFQNTGTASAINVRIEEELHESLDWNTIQILNSSHNYRVEITDGNQMEFIFNNINLPYEDEDEEGSNGFIAYKIKPIAGTQIGDFIIGNEAYIYFDYNLPIITNTTSTEVVEETSSVSVHSLKDLISVYPNPTNGILHLSSKENIIIEEVKIYNLQGRELFGSVQHLETISIENLSAGIYLMNIKTNQGVISKKVIKK